MSNLDSFGRPISYLRISVTDRCNFRCVYCMPPEGVPQQSHEEILRYEEIARVAEAGAALGISKVRITGGEPLVRERLPDLVAMLARIPGIDDLSLTTNGSLLERYAQDLARAGLQRVNISLDTLRPDRFRGISRLGRLEDVLRGIEAAESVGLTPLKLNMVVMRGLNDDEVVDFAQLTLGRDWCVRFIEMMPVGAWQRASGDQWEEEFVSLDEVRAQIEEELGELELVGEGEITSGGPARHWRLRGARGTLGFITPVSAHFCPSCNRVRLTADGRLRPCLLSDLEFDLRALLREGASIIELKALLTEAIAAKPEQHHLAESLIPEKRTMSQIGG